MARTDPPEGSRRVRLLGVVGLALRRLRARLAGGGSRRVLLATGIVAVGVALLVVVTAVGLELASTATVYGGGVDYWVVPESAGALTSAVSVPGPALGDVHASTATLREQPGVSHATPVLAEVVAVRPAGESGESHVVAIGVVAPPPGSGTSGLVPDALSAGDPLYADGTYAGEPTGELVLSPAGAERLGVEQGASLVVSTPGSRSVESSFEVTAVTSPGLRLGDADVPVAVVHLAELQRLTGHDAGDQADQVLVATDDPGVRPDIAGSFPDAEIVARRGLDAGRIANTDRALAVVLTALVVGLAVPLLVVTTTMGLEVEAERRVLAVLAAVGFGATERSLLVATTTLAVALVGGAVGVVLGGVGVVATNAVFTRVFASPPVARFHPALVAYGLGVAATTGLLAVPYPVLVARRTETVRELVR